MLKVAKHSLIHGWSIKYSHTSEKRIQLPFESGAKQQEVGIGFPISSILSDPAILTDVIMKDEGEAKKKMMGDVSLSG